MSTNVREAVGTKQGENTTIDNALVWLMAITCGLVVANIYYNQPLLGEIAKTFGLKAKDVSLVATITQLGYTIGLLLVVPLGDMLERKKLILTKMVMASMGLVVIAVTDSFYVMLAASLFVGIFSSVPQVLLPMAAHLAPAEQRGKIVGKVMSGLLIGILLSRTLSGYIGALYGWRTMFVVGFGIMVLLGAVLAFKLPVSKPFYNGNYGSLMKSLLTFIKEQPLLRQSALIGFCSFGAFSTFWTTLVFFLEGNSYNYKSDIVGLFGLIGACGAFAAPLTGKMSDRRGASFTMVIGILMILIAYFFMLIGGELLFVLIFGVILLDIGQQVTHVSNQSRIFALIPEARSRLNTVYMTSSFAGGSLGSYVGSLAWQYYQWLGVCAVGLVFMGTALLVKLRNK